MDLAFASPLYPATGKRPIFNIKSFGFGSCLSATRKLPSHQKKFSCLAAVATDTARASGFELENKKHDLLRATQETQRGLVATPDQRADIEEALVTVEGYNEGEPIDLVKLDGTWRLQYTSAPDVLLLFEAASRLPFFQRGRAEHYGLWVVYKDIYTTNQRMGERRQGDKLHIGCYNKSPLIMGSCFVDRNDEEALKVGQIFQKFECRDRSDGGIVRNVVRWSVPPLLEEQEGATLLVSAKFNIVSARNIYLQFEEISLQNIKISEELQALIAPAILPRSFLSLQILQFLRTFKAQLPVRDPGRQSVGGLYYLSYLDGNMLLGRAVGGGGVFVFTKAQPLN